MLTLKNIVKIEGRFGVLVVRTCDKLEEKKESVSRFSLFCKQQHSLFKCLPIMGNATSFTSIFECFTENGIWSYRNYHFLEVIIENFVPELCQSMVEYQNDYEGFKVATQLEHYIDALVQLPPLKSPDPALFLQLETKLQVSVSDRSLQYVDQLWKSLSQHFSLKPYTLVLENISTGSLAITWCLPRQEASRVGVMIATSSAEFFSKHGIVKVSMDSQLVYQLHTKVIL